MRKPKKVKVVKSLKEWLATEDTLTSDEILVVDYETRDPVQSGMLPRYDRTTIHNFILDENSLWLPEAEQKGIRHVAIDSLTGLQYHLLDYIVVLRGGTKSGWVGTDQDVYGKAIEKMKEIADSFVSQNFDFVLTSHVESEKDDVTGKVLEHPLIYGKKLPGLILSKMDDIYYSYSDMSAGALKFWWGTQPQMLLKIIGQRSFDNLPVRLEPDFAKLYGDRLYNGTTPGINAILIGESKSGKTVSLETFPGGLVVFSFDKGGYKSLVRIERRGNEEKNRQTSS